MQVSQERLDPCQIALTIEVESAKVTHAVDRAYREYARYVSVPGFRKGKAPLHYVRQRIPESEVRQRTVELLVEPAYEEAIKEVSVEPYAQPKLELVQLDFDEKPFIFKALVPLAPVVTLGKYTGVKAERRSYKVEDADVDTEVERLRQRAVDYPKVERPAQMNDLLIADLSAVVDGDSDADVTPRPTMIEIGSDNIPGFDAAVLGISPGETRTFALTYPNDYHDEDVRGQKATFTVLAKEVREKQLPELTDDLAKKLTEGRTETLDALKAEIRDDMTKRLERASENAVERDIIDKVVAAATVNFPPVLVDAEVDDDRKDLEARLAEDGRTIADYLRSQEKTEEQLEQELVDAATKRVGSSLVLGEIARTEKLELTDTDVDAYIEFLASEQNATSAAVRAFIESRGSMGAVRNRAQTRKVIDYLKSVADITTTEHSIRETQATPDTDAPAPEKGKRTKKKAESK